MALADRPLYDALALKRRLHGGKALDVERLTLTGRAVAEAIAEEPQIAVHSVALAATHWLNVVTVLTPSSRRLSYGERLIVDKYVDPDAVLLLATLVDNCPLLELVA